MFTMSCEWLVEVPLSSDLIGSLNHEQLRYEAFAIGISCNSISLHPFGDQLFSIVFDWDIVRRG